MKLEIGLNLLESSTNGDRRVTALIDDGLMLLSSHQPETPMQTVPFVSARGTELLASKGFQYGVFQVSGQRILVVHTHLQDPTDPCCCGRIKAYRSQVDQLVETIKGVQRADMITILLGDLNTRNTQSLEQIRTELNLRMGASCGDNSLDQILLNVNGNLGSDHRIVEKDPYSDHPILMYRWKQRVFPSMA